MKITKGWDYATGEYVTRIVEGEKRCTVRVGSSLNLDVASDDSSELDYSINELVIKVSGYKELAIRAAGADGLKTYLNELLEMKR